MCIKLEDIGFEWHEHLFTCGLSPIMLYCLNCDGCKVITSLTFDIESQISQLTELLPGTEEKKI